MIESIDGNEDNEISPELKRHTEELREGIGGEEGIDFARQEELRFELGRTLEELIKQAPGTVHEDIAKDPQTYVDAYLTAPEDSELRQQLIAQFEKIDEAGEFVDLLKEMDELVSTP